MVIGGSIRLRQKGLGLKIPSDACLVPSDPASVHRGRSRGDPISAAVPFDCLSALAAAVCRSGAWADLGAWDYLCAQAGEAIGDQFPFPGAVDKQRTLDSPTKGGFGNGRPKIKYVMRVPADPNNSFPHCTAILAGDGGLLAVPMRGLIPPW